MRTHQYLKKKSCETRFYEEIELISGAVQPVCTYLLANRLLNLENRSQNRILQNFNGTTGNSAM